MTTTTTAATATTAAWSSSLPLEWTHIKRQKRSAPSRNSTGIGGMAPMASSSSSFSSVASAATEDPFRHCNNNPNQSPQSQSTKSQSTKSQSPQSTNLHRIIQGTVYICLPDPDSDWFQGYLFPTYAVPVGTTEHENHSFHTISSISSSSSSSNSSSYFGLLGTVLEMDDCLHCDAGGYHHLAVQVQEFASLSTCSTSTTTCTSTTTSTSTTNNINNNTKLLPTTIANIVWTGGDMMQLTTSNTNNTNTAAAKLDMETTRLWTGTDAVTPTERYFGKLLDRLRHDVNPTNTTTSTISSTATPTKAVSVLELMPHVAILQGTMRISIPLESSNSF